MNIRFFILALLMSGAPLVAVAQIQDPWGCPLLDACVDGPPGGYTPLSGPTADFISMQINNVGGSGGGAVAPASEYNNDPNLDIDIQLPGLWSYYSSVTGGRGLKVNGSEYVIYDTSSTPPTYSTGHSFNEVIDQAGNKHFYFGVSKFGQEGSPRLHKVIYAGGGEQNITYDLRGNIKKREFLSDDGLSTISVEKGFVATCSNVLTCNKPEWTKDANLNQTDFVYNSTHGMVESVKAPADDNGKRPETRYQYGQRYAWVAASGGGYVQESSPIWLLTSESYCRTSNYSGSSCESGASDEVVTTYDYGPNSGPNNLWLRGVVVTAEGQSLRTCYTYDVFGNQLTETAPNANLTSCQ